MNLSKQLTMYTKQYVAKREQSVLCHFAPIKLPYMIMRFPWDS